jgi:hypothetical protein
MVQVCSDGQERQSLNLTDMRGISGQEISISGLPAVRPESLDAALTHISCRLC